MSDSNEPNPELPKVVAPPILVPMFPLPNLFLFPGTFMPLHIFEPRYRQMVEDCLDGPGRIVVASVLEEAKDSLNGSPPVYEVGGLGEIARHERLDDGRFMIWLAGLARVQIVGEEHSERLYRKVLVRPLCDQPITAAAEAELRPRVAEAVLARTPEILNVPPEVPMGHLVDLLLLRMGLPQSLMQDAYGRLCIEDRARRALELHRLRPAPSSPPKPPPDLGPSLN